MVLVCRPRETGDGRARPAGNIEYAHAYRHILRDARRRVLGDSSTEAPGGAAVLVLTAPQVDSLAAARIFTRLLADDEISFRIAPVNGYRSLQQVLAEDVKDHLEVGDATHAVTHARVPEFWLFDAPSHINTTSLQLYSACDRLQSTLEPEQPIRNFANE